MTIAVALVATAVIPLTWPMCWCEYRLEQYAAGRWAPAYTWRRVCFGETSRATWAMGSVRVVETRTPIPWSTILFGR